MRMFIFVLDSFKGDIFDFKVDRRVLVASTVTILSQALLTLLDILFIFYSILFLYLLDWYPIKR